jgi:chaperonin GroES
VTLKPLGSFILVETLAERETTESGLITIPHSAREKDGTALVIAVGDGIDLPDGTTRPLRVKAGDKVLYDKFAGVKTKVDGKEYLFLRENDLYARLA